MARAYTRGYELTEVMENPSKCDLDRCKATMKTKRFLEFIKFGTSEFVRAFLKMVDTRLVLEILELKPSNTFLLKTIGERIPLGDLEDYLTSLDTDKLEKFQEDFLYYSAERCKFETLKKFRGVTTDIDVSLAKVCPLDKLNEYKSHKNVVVRVIVAKRLDPSELVSMLKDNDYSVLTEVARRLPTSQLYRLKNCAFSSVLEVVIERIDPSELVSMVKTFWELTGTLYRIARRLRVEDLHLLMKHESIGIRQEVAVRLPQESLHLMMNDENGHIRVLVSQRIEEAKLIEMKDDSSGEVRVEVAKRIGEEHLDLLLELELELEDLGEEDIGVTVEILNRVSLETLYKYNASKNRTPYVIKHLIERVPQERLMDFVFEDNGEDERATMEVNYSICEKIDNSRVHLLIPYLSYSLPHLLNVAKRMGLQHLDLFKDSKYVEIHNIIQERKESPEYRAKFGMNGALFMTKYYDPQGVERTRVLCYSCLEDNMRGEKIIYHSSNRLTPMEKDIRVVDGEVLKEDYRCVTCPSYRVNGVPKSLKDLPPMLSVEELKEQGKRLEIESKLKKSA